jgi:hypothetical protein
VTPLVKHSRIVRKAVAVAKGSLFCRALGASARPLIGFWQALGRADAQLPPATGPALPSTNLQHLAVRSWLIGKPQRLAAKMRHAIERAACVRLWRTATEAGRALPPPERVRLAGVFLMAAVLTHISVVASMPARLRPAMPWYVAMPILGLSIIMIAASEPVARAWSSWRRR